VGMYNVYACLLWRPEGVCMARAGEGSTCAEGVDIILD
jgi:hypothetical protein